MNKNIFKSIGAVVAGLVAIIALSLGADILLGALGIFPGITDVTTPHAPWMLVIALVYRSIFTVIGGYITARLAPQNPMRHVYVVMGIVLVLTIFGAIAGWSLGNQWYSILLVLTGPLFILLGGKLYK